LIVKQSPSNEAEKAYMSRVPYASAVGSLMYAMVCTRPDMHMLLVQSVNFCQTQVESIGMLWN